MDSINAVTISQYLTQRTKWQIPGRNVRVMQADVGITLELFRGGISLGRLENFLGGLAVEDTEFDAVQATPSNLAFPGDISIVISDAAVKYERGASSANISNLPAEFGAHVHSRAVVGSGAVVQLLAAKAARRFLLLQNNDLSVAVRVTVDGTAPTAAQGVRIVAGGSLLLDRYTPVGIVSAIAESGAGCAVEVQEG